MNQTLENSGDIPLIKRMMSDVKATGGKIRPLISKYSKHIDLLKSVQTSVKADLKTKARNLEIATMPISRIDSNLFTVKSKYVVDLLTRTCTCTYFGIHKSPCKHIKAVEARFNVKP